MSTCPKCKRESEREARFCSQCGASFAGSSEASHPPDPFLGRTLKGVYRVQEKIGDGGMGLVYRAIHVELDAPFAVKIIRGALLSDPSVVGRFQQEARAACRLRHPNVVSVTDFGQTDDGILFMVMEHVPGRSLARLIAEEAPLPERRVVHIAEQVLSALAEAHAGQILHRDLKPENVMVEARRDATDSVKVLDFGIAKALLDGAPAKALTQAGLVVGTPGYMSPEQLSGEELDPRADLYSVGVVLYEMLTGKLPFPSRTPVQLARLQETGPPLRPSERRSRPVSRELEALVMRALAPLPEDRPGSADGMREQLLQCPVEDDTTVATQRAESAAREEDDPADGRSELLERLAPTPASARRERPSAIPTPGRPSPGPRTPIDPVVLAAVEKRALALLGPLAPILLRKASVGASTVEELVQNLACFAPSEAERKALLAPYAPARPTPSRTPSRVEWDPAALERIQRHLATFIGPVARIVVQRASVRAGAPSELHEIVAREIADAADRRAFLASVAAPDTNRST
jgi:serine/threonine protein kinase